MENLVGDDTDLNLKATELRLGLPGTDEAEKEIVSSTKSNKRTLSESAEECVSKEDADSKHSDQEAPPAAK